MNNEMTFNLHRIAANRAEEIAKKSVEKMSAPVRWLRGYYSNITGRELSTRQMWSLIEAQTAFFLGVMPADYALVARVALLGWSIVAIRKCATFLSGGE